MVTTEKLANGSTRTDVFNQFLGSAEGVEMPMGGRIAKTDNTKVALSAIRTAGTAYAVGEATKAMLGASADHVSVENAKTAAEVSKENIKAGVETTRITTEAATEAAKLAQP